MGLPYYRGRGRRGRRRGRPVHNTNFWKNGFFQ